MGERSRRMRVAQRTCWPTEFFENPDLAGTFVKKSEAQQSLLLLLGLALFWVGGPFYIINIEVFATFMLLGTLTFFLGLVFDVKLIQNQREAAEAARPFSQAISDVMERNIAWRWTAAVLNLLGGLFSIAGCLLYFPVSSLRNERSRRLEEWNANALFGMGTLLFCVSYSIVAWDVEGIRHAMAEMSGEAKPYWDDTAKVMWAFGISLGMFAGGNFLILLPEKAFQYAGAITFLVGFVIITAVTVWQLSLQWNEHVRPSAAGLQAFQQMQGAGRMEAGISSPLLGREPSSATKLAALGQGNVFGGDGQFTAAELQMQPRTPTPSCCGPFGKKSRTKGSGGRSGSVAQRSASGGALAEEPRRDKRSMLARCWTERL